jgi:hypothetical protein
MQGTELLIPLAEIAGVFVGFGALIAVRGAAASETHELVYIESVVSMAIWVVIAALVPVIVGGYGVTGHTLWVVCSLLALVLFAAIIIVVRRTPEHRAEADATWGAIPVMRLAMVFGSTIWLPIASIAVAFILVVVGLFPDQEQALYLTAVSLGLFEAGFLLLVLVFWQRYHSDATDGAGVGAPGGSSA